MPIGYTVYSGELQFFDGSWLYSAPSEPINTERSLIIPDSLPEGWSSVGTMSVIGDFDADIEVLRVHIDDETAVLFDPDTDNDIWFSGNTLPTNGTDNTLLGAWPETGNITVNTRDGGTFIDNVTPTGNEIWQSDVDAIDTNSAEFASDNPPVELSFDFGVLEGGTEIKFTVTEFDLGTEARGVDVAEIDLLLQAQGEWTSENAISNVVFYLECDDDEIIKVKIDDWDELAAEYKSTEMIDFTEDNILDFVDAMCKEIDCEDLSFIAMTIKAGNNRELSPRESVGEGEIVFGDRDFILESHYGKLNDFDCTVDAVDVFSEYFLIA